MKRSRCKQFALHLFYFILLFKNLPGIPSFPSFPQDKNNFLNTDFLSERSEVTTVSGIDETF